MALKEYRLDSGVRIDGLEQPGHLFLHEPERGLPRPDSWWDK